MVVDVVVVVIVVVVVARLVEAKNVQAKTNLARSSPHSIMSWMLFPGTCLKIPHMKWSQLPTLRHASYKLE